MRKISKALIILLILISVVPVKAKAATVTSINDLIENAKALEGQEVTIQGEAIGESMNRGEYSWINMNDQTNAIGVWISNDLADKVNYYGDYKNIGDKIQITGIFYRACVEHGGEADVHSDSLDIIKTGSDVKEQIPCVKVISALILVLAAFFLFGGYCKIKKEGNKAIS